VTNEQRGTTGGEPIRQDGLATVAAARIRQRSARDLGINLWSRGLVLSRLAPSMSLEHDYRETLDVVTNRRDEDFRPECGARFASVPCRSCQGTGRLLFFFECRTCGGMGEKVLCPNFLFHSRYDRDRPKVEAS
jgi:hypothetical protein